jgi:quercetin dioxygenase-like cupin family protein
MILRLGTSVLALVVLATAGNALMQLDPAAVAFRTPDQFKWRDPTMAAPNNQTVLYGTPSKPGFYIYINTSKPNRFSAPHHHPNDRFIMVMKGPWWVGSGTMRDGARAVAMPVGSFVIHHGKQVHWDGTKDAESAILIIGEGPATQTRVPETGPSTPLDPKAVTYTLPNQIKWRDPANKGPSNSAVLYGDPSKPGLYINLTKWNKGNNFSRPHFHPNDRFIAVLSGTWWMGSGPKFDPANSVPLRAGTFVTHFAKQVHWDGAKDEDAVLLIAGMGPATSTRLKQN